MGESYDPLMSTAAIQGPGAIPSYGLGGGGFNMMFGQMNARRPPDTYNPAMAVVLSQKTTKDQILYDPVAQGNQPVSIQRTKANVARTGSLLKVFEGALDT